MVNAILSISYLLSMAALILFLAITSFIIYRVRKDQRRRASLRHTVNQYRLSKMLAYIGVNINDYVNRIPHYAIYNHIARCKACPDISTCDRCLHDGMVISDISSFCPNYKSLMEYSRLMPARG